MFGNYDKSQSWNYGKVILFGLWSTVNRGIHSTSVKKMGGHGHGHDEPYYLHAKRMYNLERMSHQKLKVTLSVLGVVGLGIGIPVYAVHFQQKKTASG